MKSLSQAIRLAAAGALVVASVSVGYVQFLERTLAECRVTFAAVADKPAPGFSNFLALVRARTNSGDSIAIVVPTRDWDRGYSYAYFRAVYLLSGRQVLPVLDERDRMRPEKLRDARYVAAWGVRFVSDEFVTVWSADGGSLSRRR